MKDKKRERLIASIRAKTVDGDLYLVTQRYYVGVYAALYINGGTPHQMSFNNVKAANNNLKKLINKLKKDDIVAEVCYKEVTPCGVFEEN